MVGRRLGGRPCCGEGRAGHLVPCAAPWRGRPPGRRPGAAVGRAGGPGAGCGRGVGVERGSARQYSSMMAKERDCSAAEALLCGMLLSWDFVDYCTTALRQLFLVSVLNFMPFRINSSTREITQICM